MSSEFDEWRSLHAVVGNVLSGMTVKPAPAQASAGGAQPPQK